MFNLARLPCGDVCMMMYLAILIELATDSRTDSWTDRGWQSHSNYCGSIASHDINKSVNSVSFMLYIVLVFRNSMFDWDWRVLLQDVVIYAGTNPWQFVYYVLLCLSPFFAISAYLSWQLAKQIEAKEKEKKKKTRREANIAKSRRQKAD